MAFRQLVSNAQFSVSLKNKCLVLAFYLAIILDSDNVGRCREHLINLQNICESTSNIVEDHYLKLVKGFSFHVSYTSSHFISFSSLHYVAVQFWFGS